MAMEYFCAYFSYLDSLSLYSDAACGRLFRALLRYSATGQEPKLKGAERFLFPTLRQNIDRDRERYEAKCRQNQKNRLGSTKAEPSLPRDGQERRRMLQRLAAKILRGEASAEEQALHERLCRAMEQAP